MYEINKRMKELRISLGLSQSEFAAKLGLTRGAITNIELCKTDPKPLMVSLVCNSFRVNEDWLRFGVGSMQKETPLEEEIARFLGEIVTYGDDSFRVRFISALSKLREPEWAVLEKIAQTMAEENRKREQG